MRPFVAPKVSVSPAADKLRSRTIDLRGMQLVVTNNRVLVIDEAIYRFFGFFYMTWPNAAPDPTRTQTLSNSIRIKTPFIVVDKVDLIQEACWVNHWNNEKRYPFAGEFLAVHDNKQHRPHCSWFYDEGHKRAWQYYFG
jgi:hypothetical protein